MSNKQLKALTIKLENQKEIQLHKLNGFNAQLMEYVSQPKINCCSLHRLEIEPGNSPSTFNERLLDLGNKAMIIYDWVEFLRILDRSVEKMGYQFSRGKVTYYNPKEFNGNISLHHKDEQYSWQNEYRILIAPTNIKPVSVSIPGLKKISCVINANDMNRLRIEFSNSA